MSTLDKVRQLRPIQFRYHASLDPEQSLRAGFSAQQVQQIFPDAVVEVGGVLMLDMERLGAYVAQAVKESQQSHCLE